MKVAIGTQSFLPYTQSWIYRQMKGSKENVALVICNQVENIEQFPFDRIALVPNRSLFMRKIIYKLQPLLKYFPYYVSPQKWSAYYEALKRNKIDVLHVHFGVMAVELMTVCRALKTPLVVTFHGFDITAAVKRDPSYHKALLQLFQSMTLGIAISSEMRNRLVAMGCPEDKIRISYLGIPLEEFSYTDRTSHQGTVKFLHAGRFSGTKGVPDLVRAFSTAFQKEDQVELFIVGEGEEKNQVLQTVAESPIKDKIQVLGKLSNEELKQQRKDCDVFLLNCRTPPSGDQEGLPIALLEASCCGLPIISTKHSGIPEGVLHEQTGLLVDEFDTAALSMAMKRMMDSNLRLAYGKAGRQLMEKQFDLVKCNQVLDAVYKEAHASALKNIQYHNS